MAKYDYLIVGAGLFGSVLAYELTQKGRKVLVIDKRGHIGGNCYTKNVEGINVHCYGPHIFHTDDKYIWDYVNKFTKFNNFVNSPIAVYKGTAYNLPFNMNTFSRLWNVVSPAEARAVIDSQASEYKGVVPSNCEEQALSLVGRDIYEKFIKGYTQKQWGKPPRDLPSFIIKRLPVRFTYDNNYFSDRYQGVAEGGYTRIFEKMLEGAEVRLNTDFNDNRRLMHEADKTVYTGMIDEFYDCRFGALDYRSLKFEHRLLDTENFQGNAVVNYTDSEPPYTRIIEHKYFEFGKQDKTVITYEFSCEWEKGMEPYYPINTKKNERIYMKYRQLAEKEENIIFGGRLAEYRYYDMHHVIEKALNAAKEL